MVKLNDVVEFLKTPGNVLFVNCLLLPAQMVIPLLEMAKVMRSYALVGTAELTGVLHYRRLD